MSFQPILDRRTRSSKTKRGRGRQPPGTATFGRYPGLDGQCSFGAAMGLSKNLAAPPPPPNRLHSCIVPVEGVELERRSNSDTADRSPIPRIARRLCRRQRMSSDKVRRQVAWEAARLMYTREVSEYLPAKLKAARRVARGDFKPSDLPSNREIRDQVQIWAKLHEGRAADREPPRHAAGSPPHDANSADVPPAPDRQHA